MPPSGFSKKAINGLLKFVEAVYKTTENEFVKSQKRVESEFIKEFILELKRKTNELSKNFGIEIEKEGIEGLEIFVSSCFEDLLSEIENGSDKYGREVIDGKAMKKELKQLEDYLLKFRI